jgi:putative PIN family toxin of toxin-antitoxin system
MAKRRKIKVIFDTNWYISACINRKSRRVLYELLTDTRLTILYGTQLIDEFSEVIHRPKFRKYISPDQIKRFIGMVLPKLAIVEMTSVITGSRDPKDNYLLALSRDGNADYLVTGDPDLLVLERFEDTIVLKMHDFQNILMGIK